MNRILTSLTAISAACALALALTGCEDDDDPVVITMPGTAAVGAALVNATVTAVGANGATATATTDASGNYSLNATALTAPIFVKVTGGVYDADNSPATANVPYTGAPLYSLSPSLGGRINATSLTTLAVQYAFNTADLDATFTGWNMSASSFSLLAFTRAVNVIAANFATQIDNDTELNPRNFNFFTQQFSTDHTGIDLVMDKLSCTTTTSTPLNVVCNYDSAPIAFSHTPSLTGFALGQTLIIKYKLGIAPSQEVPRQVFLPPPSRAVFCAAEGNAFSALFATNAKVSAVGVAITDCSFSGNVGVMKVSVTTAAVSASGEVTFTWL